MFTALKTPLSFAAVVALTAACSTGGVSLPTVPSLPSPTAALPSIPAPTAALPTAAPAVTIPVLATAPSIETTLPSLPGTPTLAQPTLAATQVPLSIEAPTNILAAPAIDSSLIQPASVATFGTTTPSLSAPTLSAPSLSAPTLSAPALPSYTIPAVPSAPVVSPQYLIEPSIAPITDGFSQLPVQRDTAIVAASTRTDDLPIIASNSPLLQGTVYATSFGAFAPIAE